jgi:hypothetical protein
MASNNRVFVSPGVYTSELDLTFVAQSVGVTTLGLVGETLKGPAFEPILISNFDDFKLYFGSTSPEKDGDGNPKYELGYVAKSYLQESNQLFVTRVLGLTGYKPYKTFGIKTIGGVILEEYTGAGDYEVNPALSTTFDNTPEIYDNLVDKVSHDGTFITDYIIKNYSGLTNADNGKWFVMGKIPTGETLPNAAKELVSPLTGNFNSENNNTKEWYNVLFNLATPGDPSTVDAVYSYLFVWNSGTTKFDVTRYDYDARVAEDYNNVVVAAIRPRGIYSGQTLIHEVTGNTSFKLIAFFEIIEICATVNGT